MNEESKLRLMWERLLDLLAYPVWFFGKVLLFFIVLLYALCVGLSCYWLATGQL